MTDLATVAANLRSIEDMALRLEDRAIDRSNSRDMPGGDALVNLGGTTPRRWAAHVDEREQAWLDDPDLDDADMPNWSEFEDPDELWPAVQILAWWSEEYRQRLDMKYEGWRPTLVSEAKFLRNHDVAEWIWNNEVHWDDYAGDVSKAKTKLENLLHEGERAERSRVMCNNPICETPRRLIRIYADTAADDRWKCTACRKHYDLGDFQDANAAQLRSDSSHKFVNLPDAIGTLQAQGRAERTIRKWLSPPEWLDRCTECDKMYRHQERNVCVRKVKDPESRQWVECGGFIERAVELADPEAVVESYCEIGTHKVWVWWPDLWSRHQRTRSRKRVVAA